MDRVSGTSGNLLNGVGFAPGMVGEAFVFNGTNSYVEVPDSPALRLTNEVTLECWVKIQDLTAENYLINKGGDWTRGALDYGMTITQPLWSNTLAFAFAGGARHSIAITDLNWHHVAVTARNGDADPVFYVDGVQQTVTLRQGASTIYLYPSTEPLRIGAQVDPLSGWFYYSKAVVDEMSVYSRVLTAAEIQAIYNAGSAGKCTTTPCATPAPGLVSWWPGEGNATDQEGINNGLLVNGVGFAPGMVGNAFEFSSTSNSYVEVADSPTLRFTNALTIECWAKRLNTSQVHVFVEKGGDWTGGQTEYEIAVNDTWSGGSHFGFAFAGGWRGCAVTPDTAWHHYAAVLVSGQPDPVLYIDGLPQTIVYREGPASINLTTSTRALHIGAQLDPQTGWFYYSSTLVDEPAIYSRALTSAEIQAIYAAGAAGKCIPTACAPAPSGLIGWWKGDGSGADSAGTNNAYALVNIGFTNGIVGQAFTCDPENYPYGTYTGVQIADDPAYALTNSLSIEAWIRPRGDGYIIFWRGDNRPGTDPYVLSMGGNNILSFQMGDAAGNAASVSAPLVYNQWWHVAATLDDASGLLSLYTNGTLAAQITTSVRPFGALIPQDAPGIGIGNLNDGSNNFPFTGDIDEISLYNRALSASEIQAIYAAGSAGKCPAPSAPVILMQPTNQVAVMGGNATFSVLASGALPLSYQWQFDGTNVLAGTSSSLVLANIHFADAGSYSVLVSNGAGQVLSSNALLTVNPVPCAPVPSGLIGWWKGDGNGSDSAGTNDAYALVNIGFTNGVVGQAFTCDPENYPYGTYTGVQIADEPAYALTNSLSIEAWIRPRGDGYNIFWRGDNRPGTDPYVLSMGGNNILGFLINDAAGNAASVSAPLVYNQWWHVAATLDGASGLLSLYTNGTLAAQITTSVRPFGALIPQDAPGIGIGNVNDGSNNFPFQGDIDEVSLYNRALLAAEVQAIYNAGSSGKCFTPLPPVILSGPTNLTVAAGSDAAFNVTAAGTSPLSYQWLFNNTALPAQTNTSLVLPAVAPSQAGSYSVVVTNAAGAATSVAAVLSVLVPPPVFALQPQSQTVPAGTNVTFTALATNNWPLTYQWYFGTSRIAGATTTALTLTNVQATNGGSYTVVAANAWNAATSMVATLTLVDAPPVITGQPVGQPTYLGAQSLLQVTALGSGPLSYQWRVNGTNIASANSTSFVIKHVLANNAGAYSVVVSNAFGVASSAKVTIPIIQVVAWGAGTNYGAAPNAGQSIVPAGLNSAVAVAGGGYHSLALRADATVLAWGAGTSNSLIAPNYGQSMVPGGLADVTGIAAGLYHSLAVSANGSVTAWGAQSGRPIIYFEPPDYGQTTVPASASNAIAVAASDYDSFALRNDGKVVGWGNTIYSLTNVPVTASNVVAIAARGNHALALRADGSVVQWGNQTAPSPGPYNYVAIAAGVNHSLGLRSDGTVVSWGGQYPVPTGLANVVAIAAGYDHSLALRSDGTVVTWGATNTYGRNLIPPGLTNVIAIGCGYYNSLAVLGDGSPVIKLQPANSVAAIGTPTNFVAMAVGSPPPTFQWQFNGTNLAQAFSSRLTLPNVQAANAGNYRVIVSNAFGVVTSAVATLTTVVPLGQALNNSSLTWSTSGNAAWFGESAVTHDGNSAAQSGDIADSQSSTLQTTVTGPGTLTFWWKVSSEQYFDYLSFYIDSALQAAVSGEQGWQQQAFAVPAGSHALKWTYAKDPSVSDGTDAGWVDQVSFVPAPPVFLLQPVNTRVMAGALLSLDSVATGAPPLSYQWVKDGTNLSGGTSSTFVIHSATRRDSGVYHSVASNPGGSTSSSNAVLVVESPQRLARPTLLPDGTLSLLAGDGDGGLLLPSDLAGFQAQASSNLVDWVTLSNSLSLTNGMLLLSDPGSTNFMTRFYRIIEQ